MGERYRAGVSAEQGGVGSWSRGEDPSTSLRAGCPSLYRRTLHQPSFTRAGGRAPHSVKREKSVVFVQVVDSAGEIVSTKVSHLAGWNWYSISRIEEMRRGLRAGAFFVAGEGARGSGCNRVDSAQDVPTGGYARRSIGENGFAPCGATRTGMSAPHSLEPHSTEKGGREAQAMGLRSFIEREQTQFGVERQGGHRRRAR